MTEAATRIERQDHANAPMPAPASRPTLSIVTTLYNSAGTIEEFYTRAAAAAEAISDSFEIVIVDDGSPDNSLAITQRCAENDPRVKIVELSRNFGHHKAMMTGLAHAEGEYCLLIDSDLEEDPELLADFWKRLHDDSLDVVFGYQDKRAGNMFRRLSGDVAYWLFDLLIPYNIPRNHITLRLMTRPYVEALLLHKEQQTVIGGLWVITGFRQTGIAVDKRVGDTTTYSFLHRWQRLIDSVTSFSEAPLVAIFYLGFAISLGAVFYSIWLVISWLTGGIGLGGWASVMVSVWLLGGVIIFCIGVIGIYLSKIFIETKNRPYTIVRAIHRSTPRDGQNNDGNP